MAECHDWKAVCDRMPPGPATLHVFGTCASLSSKLELRRHEPQGFNPDELLLDLIEAEGTQSGSQEAADHLVEYRERARGMECLYSAVRILPDGPSIMIEQVF